MINSVRYNQNNMQGDYFKITEVDKTFIILELYPHLAKDYSKFFKHTPSKDYHRIGVEIINDKKAILTLHYGECFYLSDFRIGTSCYKKKKKIKEIEEKTLEEKTSTSTNTTPMPTIPQSPAISPSSDTPKMIENKI